MQKERLETSSYFAPFGQWAQISYYEVTLTFTETLEIFGLDRDSVSFVTRYPFSAEDLAKDFIDIENLLTGQFACVRTSLIKHLERSKFDVVAYNETLQNDGA